MKKGRPKADQTLPIKMAAAVLKLRMKKRSHKFALSTVAGTDHCAVTKVSEAWRDHQMDALQTIRLERDLEKYPWTLEEKKILDSMFQGKAWYGDDPSKLPI